MEKFAQALTVLKKYQFWAICAAVLVVGTACWWLSTAGLAAQYRQRKTKLEGDFKGVIIQANHPNQDVVDYVAKQHEALKRGVYQAWEELYSEQKKKNPFPKVLGEDFKRQFENLKPKDELRSQYRELYQNFIMGHFPRLLEMIDVRRPASEKESRAADGRRAPRPAGLEPGRMAAPTAPGERPAAGATDEEWIGTVDWDDNDYRKLEARFEWKETPSTLEVVLAQEDLWVYEALLRVIKDTNDPTPAVKRIQALEIGQDAVKAWKDAEEAVFRAGAVAAETTDAAPGMRAMEFSGPTPAADALGAEDRKRQQLLENRYVDDKGKPLAYTPEFPHAKHPYAEFKMMPVRMDLVMDQRRLPKLLVECANSNMPIEVRRVRILKSQSSPIDLATAAAAAGGGPTLDRGPRMLEGGPLRPRPTAPAAPLARPGEGGVGRIRQTGESQETAPNDIPVEIHGVIYIYNPPDREKLGTGTASAERSAEAAVELPAVPAAEPPKAVAPVPPVDPSPAPANQ